MSKIEIDVDVDVDLRKEFVKSYFNLRQLANEKNIPFNRFINTYIDSFINTLSFEEAKEAQINPENNIEEIRRVFDIIKFSGMEKFVVYEKELKKRKS